MEVGNKTSDLVLDLLRSADKVHKAEAPRSLGIDRLAGAKEPLTRGCRQPPLCSDTHDPGQDATPHFWKAKSGALMRQHARPHAGEEHAKAAGRTMADDKGRKGAALQMLEHLRECRDVAEEVTILQPCLRRVATEAEIL